MSHLSFEVLLSLSKADLLNECAALGLDCEGSIQDLRERLRDYIISLDTDEVPCSHDNVDIDNSDISDVQVDVDNTAVNNESKSKPSDTVSGKESSISPELMMMMKWMNEQSERRFEESERRFEQFVNLQREQMVMLSSRISPRSSVKDSDDGITLVSVKRSVDRLETESKFIIETIRKALSNKRSKQEVQSALQDLCRLEQRIERLLDEKIDSLDGNITKDKLLHTIYSLQSEFRDTKGEAGVYIADLERIEREKAQAGPLPQNVEIPVFDGNPIHYPEWWDHFSTLVHDNPNVSEFWKMRYLLKAFKSKAAPILAGKLGLASEYNDSIKAIQDKYGSETIIVRHLVNTIINYVPPSLKDLSNFGKFIEMVKTHTVALERHMATKDMIILPMIECKLPPSIRKAWERRVCALIEGKEVPTTSQFIRFCESEFEALNSITSNMNDKKSDSSMHDVHKGQASNRTMQAPHKRDFSFSAKSHKIPFSAQTLVTRTSTHGNSDKSKSRDNDTCLCCGQMHSTKDCSNFLSKSEQERRQIVTENKHCFKCIDSKFRYNHRCGYKKCVKCNVPHHDLISCPDRPSKNADTGNTETSKALIIVPNKGPEILPTVRANAVSGKRSATVRLALDSMSQKTFITEKLARKLSLEPIGHRTIMVQGFGGKTTEENVDSVRLKLLSLNDDKHITIEAYVKKGHICAPLQAVNFDINQCSHLRNLNLSDPRIPENAEIDVLIGQASFQHIVTGEVVKPEPGARVSQPSAWNTIFGYAIMGPVPTKSCNDGSSLLMSTISHSEDFKSGSGDSVEVEETFRESKDGSVPDLERFWNLEILGIVDNEESLSSEELRAWNLLKDNIQYDGERYSVPLLFKEDSSVLINNYDKAKRQLEAMESRLMRNPNLRTRYTEAISDYVKRGFARELNDEEYIELQDGENYFVPHHAVIKESSIATKVRIVFNASSPDSNGNSLNSCLIPGPALQPDIGAVLLRFRTKPFVLTGDIEKMFLQTRINPEYYRYQQYLWRNCDQTKEPSRYVMTRIMFGVKCSPFCAMAAIQEHARKDEIKVAHPKACEVVQDSLYVDDLLVGDMSEQKVIELYQDVTEFFQKGGWRLTKFASNSQKIIEAIPEEDRHPHTVIEFKGVDSASELTSTLGLKWNPESDNFQVNSQSKWATLPDRLTKRIMLSIISSVYDVFGVLAPFIIRGKIMMQDVWRLNLGWDELVPTHIEQRFVKWFNELHLIKEVTIPRYFFAEGIDYSKGVELHGFCDASEKAYGALVYLTYEDENSNLHSSLIICKTRVAPLKSLSIARLELMSALILAKLIVYVNKAVNLPVKNTHLWTDSEIVVAWIRKPSHTWKLFVRNRVEQIHSLVGQEVWSHCPGVDNPADAITRGTEIRVLKENDFYWHGPKWICQSKDQWTMTSGKQKNNGISTEIEREKAKVTLSTVQNQEESIISKLIARHSDYNHVRRIIGWILRWRYAPKSEVKRITRSKKRNVSEMQELTVEEVNRAETVIIRNIQKEHFADEIQRLTDRRNVPKESRLKNFDPFVDESLILRVGGRLQHSNLPFSAQHPIILPDKSRLTELLVKSIHEKGSHASTEGTMSLIRQHYQIIHLRQVVKRVLRNCLICARFRTKPLEQKMGNLPENRVVPAPAFYDVGLDFTGALQIREGSEIRKCYVCVFTCPHSRMIHFELTLSMTTEEFLQALRRFINRRGSCRSIESDNQMTFKKSQKLLDHESNRNIWLSLDKKKIDKFSAENGIKWRFITERSPFRGGYWERMNRSLKEPLRKVLGKSLLTYTELYTVLTDIESTLNQRPLSYHNSDPMDPAPITPSQLAIGRNLNEVPIAPEIAKVTVSKRYEYLQQVLSHFWKRWGAEYLPKLQTRQKWRQQTDLIKVDDIVLISEEKTGRPTWPLGRIVELLPSRDGLIRTVRLKTKRGYLVRPIQRVHLLPRPDELC